jgi:shikimate kinase
VKADKLYLVGFMGAGKSSVARALSRRIGWRAEDIDHLIEAREGKRVADIFAQRGEPYFREVESAVLHSLVPVRQVIVATGGGTFIDPANRALMLGDGAVVWLDAPLARIIERVPQDGRRPLASDRAQMEQLFEHRRAAYSQAHARFDASQPLPEIVERLMDWIGY